MRRPPSAYLVLLRPANVVTAFADVLAGFALAGLGHAAALPWLLLSSACLYAGGVVLNDYYDRDLDRVERPERPIPSGRVPAAHAARLGAALLAAGVLLAAAATAASLAIAAAIAAFVLLYDTWGKRHDLVAPINMGLCRALNLLLGASAVPDALGERWPVALVPLAYIAAVTTLSRGEVHGGRARSAAVALISLTAALSGLAVVVWRSGHTLVSAAILLLLGWRVVPPFLTARRSGAPADIRRAVMRGVLSLALVNAVIGTAFAGPLYGAAIVATALAAGWLARTFAVT